MGDSQLTSPGWINNGIRNVISFLFDQAAYWILGIMYQLFFNVASADLFSNETIMNFYGRVQIILGVFMMFQLAMTILRGIVNPGTFTDTKSGAGNFITRVATSLMLITLMMPISTPGRNEYERQVNNNGIIFGTLYSLQHRVLSNNTIGRLVLGTNDTDATYMSDDDNELKKSARIFTSTVLKGFYRINLVPENKRKPTASGDPAENKANYLCPNYDYSAYNRIDAEPSEIIAMVSESCENSTGLAAVGDAAINAISGGGDYYVLAYNPIISAIVAYVFAFILLSFTIDVAVRAVKLAVLRLIAPIPLISYMDPKGGKDSAFNAWVKLLTSTYLDLFIRLAVVYFVIFLIQDIMIHGIYMNNTSGVIGILSFIIICIGLFVFAKQAPKFIKQAMGLKDDGGKLFSGFGELAAAAALGTGAIGSFNASRAASRLSDEANGRNPNTLWNRGKHLLAGIGGGMAGTATGFNAWSGAKDHQGKAVMDAMQKRNATAVQRGASGSTLFGRANATGHRLFQGEGATSFDAETRNIAQKKDIDKSAKDLFSYLEGKGKTDGAGYRVTTASFNGQANGVDFTGRTFTGTLNDLLSAKQKAIADQQAGRGDGTFVFDGMRFKTTDASVTKLEEELGYAAGDMWAQGEEAKGANADAGYTQKKATYNEAIKGASDPNHTGLYVEYSGRAGTLSASKLKKTSKAAGGEATRAESAAGYKKKQADYGATKK